MFEIDNIDKKVVQNKYSPLNIKAIDNLKESISQIDPKKIISSALISANKRSLDNKKKIETIEQAKNNIVNSFLSEIDKTDKNIDQLRLFSKEKFNDFKNSTNLIVERTQKEAKEYISKLNLITKENKMLKKKYYDLKNQFDDILAKQKNSLKEIENMKNSENILISNKPVFNDFLKQFKAQAPKKIIEDIEKQKDGYKMLKSEYDSTINKIIFGKKIFDLKVEKEEKKISNMNYKIHELEEENSLKQENFGNLVEDLKKEIKKLQGLKEENDKYRKMLYQLYNRLIENFSLDKDINLQKKSLKLKKEDYKPNLLDDNEIFKYIKLMISSMNRSTSDQLLRETIAYSNMITRVYLKNKINLKYEPYSTFKELKDIMEKNEEKIEKLRNNVREYEEKLKIMTAENKKLNKIINYFHMEKNRNIEIKQNTLNINYRNSLKFKKLYNKERFSKQYNSSKYRNSSLGYQNKRYRLNSANPQIKRSLLKRANIVDDSDSSKTQKTSVNNIKEIKEIKKSNSIYDLNNKKIQENIDFKLLRNPLYQSIQSMNNKVINKYYQIDNKINKENKKVKDNYKKAKDQNIFTYLNEFQQLINHTNRLFLYQAKISPKFYLERNRNLSLNKPKFNKIFKKKRMNKSSDDLLQDFVSSKIISKINGIIKNLQYKDEDNNKNNMEIN